MKYSPPTYSKAGVRVHGLDYLHTLSEQERMSSVYLCCHREFDHKNKI